VGLGLLWIPLMELISGQLYQYLQSVQAYISPPIAAVFLIGVLSRRVNARGAMVALIGGFVLGLGRLVAELNKSQLSGWLFAYADINFLHFAVLLFVLCTAVLMGVSLTAPPPSDAKLAGLTYATTGPSTAATHAPPGRRTDLLLSALLAICVGLVWLYFSE
jgi:SSS family solute:Na+ symporter